MNTLFVFLQAVAGSKSMLQTVALFGGLIIVFYFFMIRPQQKKQKAVQQAREAMKVGDKVITAGGIHGKIKEVNDTTFLVEIADNTRIKIDKGSVYAVTENTTSTK